MEQVVVSVVSSVSATKSAAAAVIPVEEPHIFPLNVLHSMPPALCSNYKYNDVILFYQQDIAENIYMYTTTCIYFYLDIAEKMYMIFWLNFEKGGGN
jgi:hypothetical protein